MQTSRRLLVRCTLSLGLGLFALLAVARLGTWPTAWPLPLLDTFALYAFVPFGGVAIVALLTRSRSLGLLGLAALLFFGQQYGTTAAGGRLYSLVAHEEDTPVAELPAYPGTPRWVKILGIIALVLVLVVGIAHLTGVAPTSHTPPIQHGR